MLTILFQPKESLEVVGWVRVSFRYRKVEMRTQDSGLFCVATLARPTWHHGDQNSVSSSRQPWNVVTTSWPLAACFRYGLGTILSLLTKLMRVPDAIEHINGTLVLTRHCRATTQLLVIWLPVLVYVSVQSIPRSPWAHCASWRAERKRKEGHLQQRFMSAHSLAVVCHSLHAISSPSINRSRVTVWHMAAQRSSIY